MDVKMLLLITLAVGSLLSLGCNNAEPEEEYIICDVTNPAWFMELIEEAESKPLYYAGSVIYQHKYKSSYLFHFEIPVSSCAYCKVYDCDGNLIEWSSDEEFTDYLNNRTDETIIWHWEE